MPKLLLVEDDNNLREIYAARMQAEGYEVVTAADGEEALVTGKAEKPDLIISDVMMPKISGFEMLDIIRNTEGMRDVKIIMLTALGQSDEQERADKLGADKYLVKSQVTLEDIVNAAHEMLGDKPDAAAAPAGVVPAAPEAPASADITAAPAAETPAPEAPVTEAAPVTSEPVATPDTETPATPEATPAPAPEVPAAEPAAVETAPAAPEAAPASEGIAAVVPGASESASAPEDTNTTATGDSQALTSAVDSLLATAPAAEAAAPTEAPESTSSGMKVIDPIQTEPTKDINQLLAEEEAKNPPAPEATINSPAPAPEAPATPATEPAPEATPAPAPEVPAAEPSAVEAAPAAPEAAPAPDNPAPEASAPKIDPNSAL